MTVRTVNPVEARTGDCIDQYGEHDTQARKRAETAMVQTLSRHHCKRELVKTFCTKKRQWEYYLLP